MRTESGPLRKLPPSLGSIAEVAGRQGALTLVERHGGAYLKVPRRYRAGHPLSLLLGAEALHRQAGRSGAHSPQRRDHQELRGRSVGGGAGSGIRLERAPHLGDPQNARLMTRLEKNRKAVIRFLGLVSREKPAQAVWFR
ncbi:MAG: hypothetical protein OXL36_14210 [Bryobacterales bacterium]|nr:hypothetical protein [Bryobacterales bacterium]MDE0293676.1 hypothetical protein [Bryobacterales bacterium]